eukprot:354064-Chlamydomonas_euryale.AAC.13
MSASLWLGTGPALRSGLAAEWAAQHTRLGGASDRVVHCRQALVVAPEFLLLVAPVLQRDHSVARRAPHPALVLIHHAPEAV